MTAPFSATLNHLLAEQPEARRQLAAHRGKVVCIDTGIITLLLQVDADGLCRRAAADAVPNVTIRLRLADLPLIAQQPQHAFSHVQIAGDADFAQTISQLGQNLRWDVEHDLSRLLGDIAAHRLAHSGRTAIDGVRGQSRKLLENITEYLLEEEPLLVRPLAVTEFTVAVNTLRNDVERLTKRLERLEQGTPA